jgi:putative flippase GtrA
VQAIFRLARYAGVNAVLLPFNLLLAWFLTAHGVQYLVATSAGYVAHLVVAFFINRRWTFKKPEVRTMSGLLKVVCVEIVGVSLLLVGTYIGYELLKFPFIFARIASSFVAFFWNYCVESLFVWKVSIVR